MARKRDDGKGSIYPLKNGRFGVSLRLGEKPDGTPDRKTTSRATRREAQDVLDQWIRDRDAGLALDSGKVTLAKHLETWLELSVVPVKRATTAAVYRNAVHRHIIPAMGQRKLREVSALHIERFLQEKRREGLSNASIALLSTVLRQSFEKAQDWDILSRNVARRVTPPKVKRERPIPNLTPEQAARIIELCREDWYGGVAILVITAGMRPGEMLGLRWEDVHLDKPAHIRVVKQMQYIRGVGNRLVDPKTQKGERVIHLPEIAVKMLLQQWDEQRALGREGDMGLVFTDYDGKPLNPVTPRRALYRILDKAGIERVSFRDLRRVYATLQHSLGVPVKVVMEQMGHASPGTTLGHYTQALTEDKAAAARLMDELLGGSGR